MASPRHPDSLILVAIVVAASGGPCDAQQDSQALTALVRRANALATGTAALQHEQEYLDIIAAAAKHVDCAKNSCRQFVQVLDDLAYCTTLRSQITDTHDPARHLVTSYVRFAELHATHALSAATFRNLAETCLHAGDLRRMATAIDAGRATLGPTDQLEAAMLAMLAARLHSLLGRLETAADFVAEADAAARSFAAMAASSSDPTNREQLLARAAGCTQNIALAAADVFLLGGKFDRALQALERLGDEHPASTFYRRLIHALQGDREAERWLDGFLQHAAEGQRLFPVVAAKLIQVALDRGDEELAEQRLDIWRRRSTPAAGTGEGRFAMLTIELALRGRLPLDDELRDNARAAFAAMLTRWRSAPDLAGGIGFLQLDDRAALVCNLVRLEQALDPEGDGMRRGYQHLLAAHSASHAHGDAVDPDQVTRELLAADHVLLAYLPGRFSSALLVVDGNGQRLLQLPAAGKLRALAGKLVAAAGSFLRTPEAGGDELALAAKTAAEAMLPAELRAQLIDSRRLTICGAGMLQNAPFELLPVAFASGEDRLGTKLAIDYVANLPQATAAAKRRSQGQMLLAASLLTTRGGTKPYRVDRAYTDECLAAYAAKQDGAVALLDSEVTATRILAGLDTAAVAHLIGHGVIDWRRQYENGIVFNDDPDEGGLWGGRVLGRNLPGLVAILSACRAGTAPWRRGGDPLAASLAGTLLAAGARCVLVPTTEVEFGRHMQAMAELHRQLAAGLPPADALLAARRSVTDDVARVELLLMQIHGRGF